MRLIDMTIDEAIAHEKRISKDNKVYNFENIVNYHEQIAEWLEDYNRIKMLIPIEQALKAEYNKAIDDLMEKVSECFISGADWNYLVQVAEQLKEGRMNEQSI